MTSFKFTKMQGMGNDFVVIDGVNQSLSLETDDISLISDRRFGIGCDQVLIVSAPKRDGDFTYSIFNADGSPASHCGNGARCLAVFIHEKKLSDKKSLILEIEDRKIQTVLNEDQSVTVDMGEATLQGDIIIDGYHFTPVTIGNVHVITQDSMTDNVFLDIAQRFQSDKRFNGVNVSMLRVGDGPHIYVNTFERGVGLTLACGSAATACAYLAIEKKQVHAPVSVHIAGGSLIVNLINQKLTLTGPAEFVFDGDWHYE